MLTETVAYSAKYGYAGAMVAIAYHEGKLVALLDWKTSIAIYSEDALQVAAYAKALEEMTDKDAAAVDGTLSNPQPIAVESADGLISIVSGVDLAVTMEADRDTVGVGGRLTYAISVTNNSTSTNALGVRVTDTLPSEVNFESASKMCTESDGVITCDVGELGSDETAEMTIVVTVNPSAIEAITNTAPMEGDQVDPDLTNNSDTEETAVVPIPCTLEVELDYADSTLTMDFNVGTLEPAL